MSPGPIGKAGLSLGPRPPPSKKKSRGGAYVELSHTG